MSECLALRLGDEGGYEVGDEARMVNQWDVHRDGYWLSPFLVCGVAVCMLIIVTIMIFVVVFVHSKNMLQLGLVQSVFLPHPPFYQSFVQSPQH